MTSEKRTRIIKKSILIVLTSSLWWAGLFMLTLLGHNCTHYRNDMALPPITNYALFLIETPWFMLLLPLCCILLIARSMDYTFTALGVSLFYLIFILIAVAGFVAPYILM
jgi:hypothetical protein